MLTPEFFARDACLVAKELLGKVIRHRCPCCDGKWLAAQIIETEAYYRAEKGSHASLGETPSRAALFMPAGTIYMYYARGRDSFNVSCHGAGNAVLIKSAYPYSDHKTDAEALVCMQGHYSIPRKFERLCAGQTLLCQALGLKLVNWNKQQFDQNRFYIEDVGYAATDIIQVPRLGIPLGRDEHLPYRFVDSAFAQYCTSNPLKKKRTAVTSV